MEGRLNFLSNVSLSFILLFVFSQVRIKQKLFFDYTCRHVGCWLLVSSWIILLNSVIIFRGIWSCTSKKERVANSTTMKSTDYTVYQESHKPFSQFLLIISVFYCAK